jgi:outer membrane lipoprotein-sorting protein
MKTLKIFILCFCAVSMLNAQNNYPSGKSVLAKITQNMSAKTKIVEAKMEIAGSRGTRIMQTKTWSEGEKKAYIEILAPEREKGTKMLKLDNKLWIYSPKTKRSIEISGQMLRQSMLGSDMSYEDMMSDSPMQQKYSADVTGEETIDGRKCWILTLTALKEGVNYHTQKMWVDQERNVPLRIDMFSRNGKLLKRLELSDVERIQGRWFPKTMVYKDMLKEGKDTKMTIIDIQFDEIIPTKLFEKTYLK